MSPSHRDSVAQGLLALLYTKSGILCVSALLRSLTTAHPAVHQSVNTDSWNPRAQRDGRTCSLTSQRNTQDQRGAVAWSKSLGAVEVGMGPDVLTYSFRDLEPGVGQQVTLAHDSALCYWGNSMFISSMAVFLAMNPSFTQMVITGAVNTLWLYLHLF